MRFVHMLMSSSLDSRMAVHSPAMIHIHRTFFAQALLDHPTNPLASPYAPSFLAANRCASILLRSFLHHWNRRYTHFRPLLIITVI